MRKLLEDVFSFVWIIRLVIALVLTAGVAKYVSFKVADYVVVANTSSANVAMNALQSSIDRLNETVLVSNEQLVVMRGELSKISQNIARQEVQVAHIRSDLSDLQSAVQDYGIVIRANADIVQGYRDNMLDWGEIRGVYDLNPTGPITWQMVPVSPDGED